MSEQEPLADPGVDTQEEIAAAGSLTRAQALEEARSRRSRMDVARLAIGWSWPAFADAIGVPVHTAMRYRDGKLVLSLVELEWLEKLAECHTANPYPAGARETDETIRSFARVLPPLPPSDMRRRPKIQSQSEEGGTISTDRVVNVVADLYVAGAGNEADVVNAAYRSALSVVAHQLNLLAAVKAAITAVGR